MMAISMMQPYAWLFSNGYLTIDDRTWSTNYRGEIAIHASKKFHNDYYDFLLKNTAIMLPLPGEFDFGGVVGIGKIIDCILPNSDRAKPDLRRSHFGAPGYYGFVFEDAFSIPFLEVRGNRGLFSADLLFQRY